MIHQFTFNHFGTNCYVVVDNETLQCAVVDPCMETNYEDAQLFQLIEQEKLIPVSILLTHAHVDHICGLRQATSRCNLPVTMHPDGVKLLRQAEAYGSIMGFDVQRMDDLPLQQVDEGDVVRVGNSEIKCLHVPGHCPGSLCFVVPAEQTVITGDTLFQGSIGRSDLPGGKHQQLVENLRSKILTLPDNYKALPGHGESTTIGDEKHYNPFL